MIRYETENFFFLLKKVLKEYEMSLVASYEYVISFFVIKDCFLLKNLEEI